MSDHVDALLASVQRCIADQGGELVGIDELREELAPRARRPAARSLPPPVATEAKPAAEAKPREWLLPATADVRYSDVWIARTASGSVALVHVSSYRRRHGRDSNQRRRWYGTDILTQREVRIVKVLDGSKR